MRRDISLHILLHLCLITGVTANPDLPQQFEVTREPYARFETFTALDGAGLGLITAILQDRTGYIWLGSNKGLARFDGFQLRKYTASGAEFDLPDSHISSLVLNQKGLLWVGTKKGICYYDEEKDGFVTVYGGHHLSAKTDSMYVRAMLLEGDSLIWLSMLDGTFGKYNIKSGRFTKTAQHRAVDQPYYPYHTVFKDRNGVMYVGGRGVGPARIDSNRGEFVHLPVSKQLHDGTKREYDVSLYFQDEDEALWVAGLDGLYYYSLPENHFTRYMGGTVYSMHKDREGNYWIGSGSGVYRIDWENQRMYHHTPNQDDPGSLGGERIFTIFEDRIGRIWLAHENGVSTYLPTAQGIQHFFRIPGLDNTPSSSKITTFEEAGDGMFWVGTKDAGLNLFNKDELTFTHLNKLTHLGMRSNRIKCLQKDRQNHLYIGYWAGVGFAKYNPLEQAFENFRFNPNGFEDDWYNAMALDENGLLYLGFWGGPGLTPFDTHTKQFKEPLAARFANPYHSRLVTCLHFDRLNRLWVGTTHTGIHYYDAANDTSRSFLHTLDPNGGFEPELVHHIAEDDGGGIWVASSGLWHYHDSTGTFEKIRLQPYLEPIQIYKLISFNQSIWLLTDIGLLRYHILRGWVSDYSMLVALRFRSELSAAMAIDDHRVLLGGENGLAIIEPQLLGMQQAFPRLFLTFMQVHNHHIVEALHAKNRITLPYNQNFFSIYFGTDRWEEKAPFHYYYKIDDFTEDWVELEIGQRAISLTNVPPGSYNFRLRAGDHFGNMGMDEVQLFITIGLPWWNQWWFVLAVFLLVSALLYYLWYTHIHEVRLAQQNILLSQTLLRLQMNPHFIFNAMTAIQNYIYNHQVHLAGQYLADFSRLIRLILDNSRHDYISLEKEIETMTIFVELQKLRFKTGFACHFHIDPAISPDLTFVPPMLAQPFLENAIEHGLMPLKRKGNIHVKYTLAADLIHLEIIDDGVGIKASEQQKKRSVMLHDSLSIKICRERLAFLHKRKKRSLPLVIEEIIEGEKVMGTRVVFSIPYTKSPA